MRIYDDGKMEDLGHKVDDVHDGIDSATGKPRYRWLPSKRTRVKPSTTAAYERNIRLHINLNIGRVPLQKL